MDNPSRTLALFCWVLGMSQEPILVEIDDSKTVGHLKKEIVAVIPNTSSAIQLRLLKVSIPTPPSLTDEIVKQSFSSASVLVETQRLSDTFLRHLDEPAEEAVHIIALSTDTEPFHRPYSPVEHLDSTQKSIDKFLENLRPNIKQFLTKPRLPVWEPPETVDQTIRDFYHELSIPSINDNRPNLLLHNLGAESNTHADNLFRGGKHRILCNTSGAGKTRLLFEGLCNNWGFDFVAAQDTNGIGAQDLELAIERMWTTEGWVDNIFEHRDANAIKKANAANEKIAFNRIYRVLVARWIVFQTFIQVAKEVNGGNLPDTIKHDWLLFQILPLVVIDAKHPFVAFMDCLSQASTATLQTLLQRIGPTVVLGPEFNYMTFFYVVDEAQVAGQRYMGAFADAHAEVPRPVLCPLIRACATSRTVTLRIIVSGTGFSLDLFKTVFASGVGKDPEKWDVRRETGHFTNQDKQAAYIYRYIPRSFLLSPSGATLVTRMFEWLRGRHRFTARYLEELIRGAWMEDHPSSPHKLLDAYVHAYTEFTPIDGDRMILLAEPNVKPPELQGFPWEKLTKEEALLKELSKSLHTFILRGTYPMWYAERHDLVERGIACFIRDDPNVIIEEPMALMSIFRHFEKEGPAPDDIIRFEKRCRTIRG